jgi:general secretion pathway protein I
MDARRTQRGFTLIEVMIALTILAIAMGAMLQTTASTAANSAHLRDRTFAQWVATNLITEWQLAESWPDLGKRSGDVEFAGQRWYWQREVQKVEDPMLRRLDVQVRRERNAKGALVTQAAFLSDPQLRATPDSNNPQGNNNAQGNN